MEGAPRPQSGAPRVAMNALRSRAQRRAARGAPDYGRRAPSIRATGPCRRYALESMLQVLPSNDRRFLLVYDNEIGSGFDPERFPWIGRRKKVPVIFPVLRE